MYNNKQAKSNTYIMTHDVGCLDEVV